MAGARRITVGGCRLHESACVTGHVGRGHTALGHVLRAFLGGDRVR